VVSEPWPGSEVIYAYLNVSMLHVDFLLYTGYASLCTKQVVGPYTGIL